MLGHAIGHFVAIVTAITLLLMPGGLARAQTSDESSAGSINLGARAGLAADAPVRIAPRHEEAVSPFEFSARAGFASDYIYRGVTLSDHKPAVGADLEAMLLRDSNTGGLEVYDISNNQITNAAFIGTVGLDWQFSGVGNFSGVAGETDLLLRNVNTGGLEVQQPAHRRGVHRHRGARSAVRRHCSDPRRR